MTRVRFALFVVGVLALSLVLHLGFVETTPWDWDEPVYTAIAQATQELGYPSFQVNVQSGDATWYIYHPPFHFYMLSSWYNQLGQNDIAAGRLFISVIAVSVVGLAMLFTYKLTQNKSATVMVGGVLALDGWFNYSSLLVKLDTSAALLGVVGMIFFLITSRKSSRFYWAIGTGLMLGLAAIYKHIGGLFLLAILLHWILTRRNHSNHYLVLLAGGVVVLLYVVVMIGFVGDPYLNATVVQIRRSLGLQEARGLDYGIEVAIQALVETYWAFGGTILMVGIGSVGALGLVVQHLKGRDLQLAPLTAWFIAAGMVLLGVRLRNPHYLVYLLIPASILAGLQLWVWWQSDRRWLRWVAAVLTLLLVGLNLRTLQIRMTEFAETNAFAVLEGQLAQLPSDTVMLSEEPVCALVEQPCYKLGNYQTQERLEGIKPQVLVIYTTITHRPPDSPAMIQLIAESELLMSISGWKENFALLRVPNGYWE